METEAKFIVNEDFEVLAEKLKTKLPGLKYIGVLNLPAVYYDTVDGKLEQADSIIRVREENGEWIGCFKAKTTQLRQFVEEEIVLASQQSQNIHWIEQLENYSEIIKLIKHEKLVAIVKIETTRKVFELDMVNIKLEIVLDRVNYQDGLAFENRLEIEMKNGIYQDFESFILMFKKEFPEFEETDVSKYQKAKKLLIKDA